MILFVQTFGDLVIFNPHIHVLAADGVFRADSVFVVLPAIPVKLLERGFRPEVLKPLVAERAIGERLSVSMLAWRHSGFSVHAAWRFPWRRQMCTVRDRFKQRIAARPRVLQTSQPD